MKETLTIAILLISHLCSGQLKSVIIDSETKDKIPYVNIWVENENIGTTSNEKGNFELEIRGTKTIQFSAIGFETKRISSDSIKNTLELKPLITNLQEVVIKPKKHNKKLVVGKFKKSKINHYFACGTTPWVSARYFKYQEDYNKTSFLNKIKVLTSSAVDSSKFNIRLYSVDGNGKPKDYIYNENIIGIAQKGRLITEVDISDLNIEFPNKGFFIAIEWLIIDSNKHECTYRLSGSEKKLTGISYAPSIGTVPAEIAENSWIFTQGRWREIHKNNKDTLKRYKDKYSLLAIELTLTN